MSATTTAPSEYASAEAKLLESYRRTPQTFRRAHDRRRRDPAALAARARGVCRHGRRRDARRARQGPASAERERRDVRAAGRPRRRRPWRLDLFPLLIDPAEWSAIERGVIQRAALLNRAARRSLRRAARTEGASAAAGARVRQLAVSAAVQEHRRARRSAPALRRVRSRALGGRAVVGAERPHAGAVGRRLRAREPRRRLAVPARAVRRAQRAPARELLPLVQRAVPVAVEPRSAAGRVPVAGARRSRTTSSTRISRAISASASSKARTSRCATTACS